MTFKKNKICDTLYFNWETEADESLLKNIELEKTCGNFNWIAPCVLESDIETQITQVILKAKEQLHKHKLNGISFSLLKENISKVEPQIKFSYLGDLRNCIELIDIHKEHDWGSAYILDIVAYLKHNQIVLSVKPEKEVKSEWLEEICELIKVEFINMIDNIITSQELVVVSTDFPEAEMNQDEFHIFLEQYSKAKF